MREFLGTVLAVIVVIIAEILFLPIYILLLPCTISHWIEDKKHKRCR